MHPQMQYRTLRCGDDAGVADAQRRQRQAGIGRWIDPGIDAGGGACAAVEGRDQALAGVALRQNQARRQRDQQIPAQALRIALGNPGARQSEAKLARQSALAVQVPQRLRKRIAAHQHIAPFRHRAMQQPAVAFQAAGAIDGAGPDEIFKSVHQRQGAGGDGGGEQQCLQRPGREGENAGQRQCQMTAEEQRRRPQPRQHALDADNRARQCNPAIEGISQPASRECGLWR